MRTIIQQKTRNIHSGEEAQKKPELSGFRGMKSQLNIYLTQVRQ